MNKIRDFLETAAFYFFGTIAVLMLCLLYWTCRLFGIDLNDEF